MNSELWTQGFHIMLIGMGTVFVFLTILICVVQICTKILVFINKFMPEEVETETKLKKQPQKNDVEIAIAIACAKARGGKAC